MTIDISELDKADVLMALYNAAIPAVLHGGYPRGPMGRTEADVLLDQAHYFDYVNGRALYVDISGDLLANANYDSSNGTNAAARALAPLIEAREDRKFAAAVGALAGLELPGG